MKTLNSLVLSIFLFVFNLGVSKAQTYVDQIAFAGMVLKPSSMAKQRISAEISNILEHKSQYDRFGKRLGLYTPIIDSILSKEGVPKDFKYLALMESGLEADSTSLGGAVGFWQFGEFAGRDLGLIINETIDERKSIIASTKAAASYLKKNQYFLRNWVYTVISFKMGLAGASNLAGDKEIKNEYYIIPADIDPYFIRFLALKLIYSENTDPEAFKVNLEQYPEAAGKNYLQISSETGIPIEQLISFNKWLKSEYVPDEHAYLFLYPTLRSETEIETMLVELAKERETAKLKAIQFEPGVIEKPETTVEISAPVRSLAKDKSGFPIINDIHPSGIAGNKIQFATINGIDGVIIDTSLTIDQLANILDFPVAKLQKYNDLHLISERKDFDYLYLKRKRNKPVPSYHTVIEDANLWEVSQRYGIRMANLAKRNRLNLRAELEPGTVLYLRKKRKKNVPLEIVELPKPPLETPETKIVEIPEPEPLESSEDPTLPMEKDVAARLDHKAEYHIVKSGESLFLISQMYEVTILEIQQWNGLQGQYKIDPGTKLRVQKPLILQTQGAGSNSIYDDIEKIVNYERKKRRRSNPTKEAPKQKVEVIQEVLTDIQEEKSTGETLKHTVKAGETLWSIGKEYEVSPENIITWNNLSSTTLSVGSELVIKNATIEPDTEEIVQAKSLLNPLAKKVTLKKGMTLYGISRSYNISIRELMEWNGIEDVSSIKPGTEIYVESPFEKAQPVADEVTENTSSNEYTVVRGDTPYSIAYKNNITVEQLANWNRLSYPITLKIGQTLQLTEPKEPIKSKVKPEEIADEGQVIKEHIVVAGESLWKLSKEYKISIDEIKRINNLSSNDLSIGQKIKIPIPKAQQSEGPVYHVVQPGETLYNISRKYDIKAEQIKVLNGLDDYIIQSGQRLRVR
jgi:membrane-bound lytic murein transglycosylase D